jgi:L-aspartate oxidase
MLKSEVHEYYSHYRVSNDLIELRNLITVAELIVRCALMRQESRGLHFNLDHPELKENGGDTILFPGFTDQLDVLQPVAG